MPSDPFDADSPHLYECVECSYREESDQRPSLCPNCGARMQDLSVPRD